MSRNVDVRRMIELPYLICTRRGAVVQIEIRGDTDLVREVQESLREEDVREVPHDVTWHAILMSQAASTTRPRFVAHCKRRGSVRAQMQAITALPS